MVRGADGDLIARRHGAQETVVADFMEPESLGKAAMGVDAVFHLNPAFAPREADMGVAMVRAAKTVGVARFVFSSVYHPSLLALSNHAAKLPVVAELYESGMIFTVLQPTMSP
jgi:uncharacterized protein YbjT (DUF2867 family)